MASHTPLRRICLACRHQLSTKRSAATSLSRQFSVSIAQRSEIDTDPGDAVRPRWQQTPKGMAMPVRIRYEPRSIKWACNNDPRKLDAMYVRLLGEGGDRMLSEEVKWLAVTHKSFDQGRRGFNDRLAYFGKRIVEMQISVAVVNMPRPPEANNEPDEFGRQPFEHPAFDGLLNLTSTVKANALDKSRLYALSDRYGLTKMLRWTPKKVSCNAALHLIQAAYTR